MSLKSIEVDQIPTEEADKAAIRDWAHKLTPEQWKEISLYLRSPPTVPTSVDVSLDNKEGLSATASETGGAGLDVGQGDAASTDNGSANLVKSKGDSKSTGIKGESSGQNQGLTATDSATAGANTGSSQPKVEMAQSQVQNNAQLNSNKVPTLPIFHGNSNKPNEVSYTQWRYAVTSMQNQYVESMLMQGIRQSVRGRGFDALYTLGDNPTVAAVIKKFDRLFGKSLTKSEIMKDLYSAEQKDNESIVSWSCRLEGLMIDAINYNAQQSSQRNDVLRSQFYDGLCNLDIKNGLRHKYDSGESFEELISAARCMEKELSTKVVASVQHTQAHSSENKFDTLIKRLEALEARDSAQVNTAVASHDQGNKKKFRPRGKCFLCHKSGHFKSQCWYNKNKQQGNDNSPAQGGE